MKRAPIAIGLVLACGMSAAAFAQTSSPGAASEEVRWVKKPVWVRLPTEEEILGAYPYRTAVLVPDGGTAIIVCRVTDQGLLDPCGVRSESPQYAGFGRAALAVAKFMQLAPREKDGQPTAGAYLAAPIAFRPPPEPPPATTPVPR